MYDQVIVLQHIHYDKIDDSDRNRYKCAVESVKKATVARDDVARILYVVMSLPLRLDQVTIDSRYAEKYSHEDAVDKVKAEESCIMKRNRHA